MKSQFVLSCILSSIAFISPMPGSALEVRTSHQGFSLGSPMEIQEYAKEMTNNARQIIEGILSISSDQQTFENTLKPWTRLVADLTSHLRQLDALAKAEPQSSTVN